MAIIDIQIVCQKINFTEKFLLSIQRTLILIDSIYIDK
jgi:hypothetical protein